MIGVLPPKQSVLETKIGGKSLLVLDKLARQILAVIEYSVAKGSVTELDPSDYELWLGDRYLQRLNSGLNPADSWADRITVIYESV